MRFVLSTENTKIAFGGTTPTVSAKHSILNRHGQINNCIKIYCHTELVLTAQPNYYGTAKQLLRNLHVNVTIKKLTLVTACVQSQIWKPPRGACSLSLTHIYSLSLSHTHIHIYIVTQTHIYSHPHTHL